ncbi:MAG: DNA alkylation repair protein [Methyloligellaceae bacterium]
MSQANLRRDLKAAGKPERVAFLQRYFKTGPGEYAEGDKLIGAYVGDCRAIARRFRTLPIDEVDDLLASAVHEERLVALLILVEQFKRGDAATRQRIYDLYLSRTKHINNWDLVDASAHHIVGAHLSGKDRGPLFKLARSDMLWERRIAMLATLHEIKGDEFETALAIAETLVNDGHDLVHKAVGWMLREIGKRDRRAADAFLERFAPTMPRTMLRYAVEKLPKATRQRYLQAARKAG